jgi:hypothetical protein
LSASHEAANMLTYIIHNKWKKRERTKDHGPLRCLVDMYHISEEPTASTFTESQNVPPVYQSTKLYGIMSPKTPIVILTAMRISYEKTYANFVLRLLYHANIFENNEN